MSELVQSCARLTAFFERAVELEEAGVARAPLHGPARLPLARFSGSLLRMRVGPAVAAGGWAAEPVHVALFGGTNTGKSTLVNLLLGRPAAGMDVRARFSQHPEAYPPPGLGEGWLHGDSGRFERYRIYPNARPPRYSDQALARGEYQPALAVFEPAPGGAESLDAVLWDLPDFSTEQARAYMPAVLDLAALADLLIMTVTAESYADARGLALLGLMRDSGAGLWVVGNRVAGSRDLEEDVRARIGAAAPEARLFFLPYVEAETAPERLRLLGATPEAAALRAAVSGAAREREALKRRSLRGGADFLARHLGEVFSPLEDEARHGSQWRDFVNETTATEIVERYRAQYLETEEYGEFRQTLLRVMEELEIPVISGLVRGAGELIRTPLRLLRGWVVGKREQQQPREEKILLEFLTGWLAALKAFAQQRAQEGRAADWQDLARTLADEAAAAQLRERFIARYEEYRRDLLEEIERRTREIVETIKRNPALKNTLKGLRLGTNLLSTSLAIASHGLDPTDFVLAPAVSAVTDWLWDALGRYYVEDQRRRLKQYQLESMRRLAQETLRVPASELIPTRVTQQDLAAARSDFEAVEEAVRAMLA